MRQVSHSVGSRCSCTQPTRTVLSRATCCRALAVQHQQTPFVIETRPYQDELIGLVKHNNALIVLPTGSGKTHIAAKVIQEYYLQPGASSGGTGKAVVFLAPTNPLVAQQCDMLKEKYGLRASAYQGNGATNISTWSDIRWNQEVQSNDVLVMTPDVLLHILAHGALTMTKIRLLVFDEVHHCASDHPYAQIMEDFYHVTEPQQRPRVLGLTASPEGLEGAEDAGLGKRKRGKSKGSGGAVPGDGTWGLQHRLNARLLTVHDKHRSSLQDSVPVPTNVLVEYLDSDPAWRVGGAIHGACERLETALKDLLAPAKKSEIILQQLKQQAKIAAAGQLEATSQDKAGLTNFADVNIDSWGSISMVDKQVRGAKTCLQVLGPWPAAVAAHTDLLSAAPLQAVSGAFGSGSPASSGPRSNGAGGLVDLELAKLMSEDELGKPVPEMLTMLNAFLLEMAAALQNISQQQPLVVSAAEVAAAIASAGASSSDQATRLASLAPKLLLLAGKAAVMLVMDVLSDLLLPDATRTSLLDDKELQQAAASPSQRASGALRKFGTELLDHIEGGTLQAQVWAELPGSRAAPKWQGPPLISPKVIALLQMLAEKEAAAPTSQDDWWSAIVFVETKLSALVLSKLLQSCPDVKQRLRSGHLVGDTDPGGRSSALSMNNKAQAGVVGKFREGELNLLIATNIGSEGMDFKQCQLVVAFEPPNNLTSYIQARGRARKHGSEYCWLVPDLRYNLGPERSKLLAQKDKLVEYAQLQDALARSISARTRAELAQHASAPAGLPNLSATALPHNPEHIKLPSGGIATLRLAQPLLIGVCAKLPWDGRSKPPQAYYFTSQDSIDNTFHTTIYLPSSSGMKQPVKTAPAAYNSKASKNGAALEALKQLRAAGKLDQWLQPVGLSK